MKRLYSSPAACCARQVFVSQTQQVLVLGEKQAKRNNQRVRSSREPRQIVPVIQSRNRIGRFCTENALAQSRPPCVSVFCFCLFRCNTITGCGAVYESCQTTCDLYCGVPNCPRLRYRSRFSASEFTARVRSKWNVRAERASQNGRLSLETPFVRPYFDFQNLDIRDPISAFERRGVCSVFFQPRCPASFVCFPGFCSESFVFEKRYRGRCCGERTIKCAVDVSKFIIGQFDLDSYSMTLGLCMHCTIQ